MTTRVPYFAYGSNMLSDRLCSRSPSARAIGPAWLPNWQMMFNKRSIDGSAKANLMRRVGDKTWGDFMKLKKKTWKSLIG